MLLQTFDSLFTLELQSPTPRALMMRLALVKCILLSAGMASVMSTLSSRSPILLLRLPPGEHLTLLSPTTLTGYSISAATAHGIIFLSCCASATKPFLALTHRGFELFVCQSFTKPLKSLHWCWVFCAAIGFMHHPLQRWSRIFSSQSFDQGHPYSKLNETDTQSL